MRRFMTVTGLFFLMFGSIGLAGAAQTPQATPATDTVVAGDGWQITDVQQIQVEGDPVALSPDGQWIAGTQGFTFDGAPIAERGIMCVWHITSRSSGCFGSEASVEPDSIAWSPDSTRVAFARTRPNWSSQSGTLISLEETAEGSFSTYSIVDDEAVNASPAWSPDGQEVVFVRTDTAEGTQAIMRVNLESGDPLELASLGGVSDQPTASSLHWLPNDTLIFLVHDSITDELPNGMWRVGLDGAGLAQVVASDAARPFVRIDSISQDGQVASATVRDPERGPTPVLIDLQSGAVTELTLPDGVSAASAAGVSPDGSTVFLKVLTNDSLYLAVKDLESGGVQIFDDHPLTPVEETMSPVWAENDTLLVKTGDEGALSLFTLERAS